MKTAHRNFAWSMLAYIILVVVGSMVIRTNNQYWLKIVFGLLPIFPGIFVLLSAVEAIVAQDELQQRIQLEAFALAFGGMFLLTLSESLLQGLTWIKFVSQPPGVRILEMGAFWMIGQLMARRRYT